MPKNNIYLPKENYKQVEEIREINYQVPSFEEFMRNYERDEKVGESYENEINGHDDIRIKKGYGPTTTQRLNVCCSDGRTFSVNPHFYIILESE